jgi:uncharacterized membrane protein
MKRLTYVDVLRGIAIVLMVLDHAYDWWLDGEGQTTGLAKTTEFLGSLAAPLFFYLVGVSLALSVQRASARGVPRLVTVRRLLWRGVKFIALGYALNLAVFFAGENWADLFAVDVLQAIGVCVWLTAPLLWIPTPAIGIAGSAAALLGQVIGQWSLPSWLAVYLTGGGGISYFPVALWLPYCYFGLAVGRGIAKAGRTHRVMLALVAVGLVSALAVPFTDPTWGYRHPRPLFVLFSVTIVSWLTAGLWLWTEQLGREGVPVGALRNMGMASLAIYVSHHLIGYRLLWLLGWVTGRSWRGEYGVLDPVQATFLFGALMALMIVLSWLWVARRASVRRWLVHTWRQSLERFAVIAGRDA